MKKLYLITGATGHVGTVLVSELLDRNEHVRILVLPDHIDRVPSGVEICDGDITEEKSLIPFFDRDDYDYVTLIHCAAVITISSKPDPQVWNVNVNGTDNVMRQALKSKVDRVVYVSSVHAIPESPASGVITEVSSFSPELVQGQYAKSKAAAAQKVLEYAENGLNISIVHPSGIIGPGDIYKRNHMIRTINAMANGAIPVAIKGGYDFVDSRDVACGILACEKKGRSGECNILNGHYITVSDLLNTIRRIVGKKTVSLEIPYGIAKTIAPAVEFFAYTFNRKAPLFTPYSIYTLHNNGCFSHEKATAEFSYTPRNLEESIRDSIY
ncbi:MAG: NAD-dependent epimerase/dehydratase family protein [Eubacteriales bacterium]|nr:NAD-dependent epimerase/dehydratase family protein [Eubacteriales bacterium]